MSYLKQWHEHFQSQARRWSGPSSPVTFLDTFADTGCDHSAHGTVIGLCSGGKVWLQACWAGPQTGAPALGRPGPSPPSWDPRGDDGLVCSGWVEEWVAAVAGAAHPRSRVARYSQHPQLGGRAHQIGVLVTDPDANRVFLQVVWALRRGEEPHRASRYHLRSAL